MSLDKWKESEESRFSSADLNGNDSPYLYEMFVGSRRKQWKMKPWQGIVVFLCLTVSFQLIGSVLFLFLGIYANGLAEMLFFFGGSLLTAKLLKLDLQEVFPVKKPKITSVFGSLLMWFGAYQCMTAISLVLAALFPQAYYTTGTSMNSFVTALPFFGSVIVVALIPAVSEEMLHRGILQYTLQPLGRKWMILFLMGVYFGVFHLSFIRFLPMMFLGMVIAWIRQETGSMVYPMIFHFVNNFYALAVTFLSGLISTGTAAQNISVPLYLLGYSFLMAAAGPFFLYLGSWLVKRGISGQRIPLFQGNRKAVIGMAASVIALAVVGIVLFVLGIVSYL